MRINRVWRALPAGLLLLLVLTACGSSTATSTSSPSSTSVAATACAQATPSAAAPRSTTGTLKSLAGQKLVLTNVRGKDISVTLTSSTHFLQENQVPTTALTEGTPVRVAVVQSGSTYSAINITVLNGTSTGNGTGFGNGTGRNPCANRNRARNGGSGSGTTGFRGLVGTVGQLSGNTLTIIESTGTDYTVTLTPQTQIIETRNATAAALQIGQALTVTGSADKQGTITANTVVILLSLPKRAPATPTPAH